MSNNQINLTVSNCPNSTIFANRMLEYYDNMKMDYNTEVLENLRSRTKQFLAIIEQKSVNKDSLSNLLGEMVIEKDKEGTGYNQLYFHIKELASSLG